MKKLYLFFILFLSVTGICKPQSAGSPGIIAPYPQCKAAFLYYFDDSIKTLVEAYPYRFIDYSSGNVTAWKWDFGDGKTSDERNPLHFYDHRGDSLTVCLSITTSDNCSSTYCLPLITGDLPVVPPPPPDTFPVCKTYWQSYSGMFMNADIRFVNDCTVSPLPGQFYFVDLSPQPKIKWHWEFDDGTSTDEQNPVHNFAMPGRYTVCLTTETPDHCISTYCDSVYAGVQPPCSLYGTVVDYTGLDACGLLIELDDGTILEPAEIVPNFLLKAGQRVRLSYTVLPDVASVCMAGVIARIDCIEEVWTPPPPVQCDNFIHLTTDVILNGQACNGTARAGLVNAEGIAVFASQYLWSTGETGPSVSNLCPGMMYSIVITDSSGCKVSGSFSFGSGSFYPDSLVVFWNVQQDNMSFIFNTPDFPDSVKCIWDFGDGAVDTGNYVSHTYENNVNYTVALNIYDKMGNLMLTQQIPVTPGSTSGLDDHQNQEPIVYPVPAGNTLYIKPGSNAHEVQRIEIVNAGGQIMGFTEVEGQPAGSTLEMDVSELNSGFYMGILVFKDGSRSRFSFVK